MIIDNIQKVESLLEWKSREEFYFVSIIKRRKDFPTQKGGIKSSQTLKSYYIFSLSQLHDLIPEIKDICRNNGARAYIWINRRNTKDLCIQAIHELSRYLIQGNSEAGIRVWNHVVGTTPAKCDKKWIIDIDTLDQDFVDNLVFNIDECKSNYSFNVIDTIPTLNGFHIITHPFNRESLTQAGIIINAEDIHIDAATILYYENYN